MTCPWCGDRHGSDQLCQRAQRGMTRRSFCFLFGAGVAGALVAPSLAWGEAAHLPTVIAADATMTISGFYDGSMATFTTRKAMVLGQEIAVEANGLTVFRGSVSRITTHRGSTVTEIAAYDAVITNRFKNPLGRH